MSFLTIVVLDIDRCGRSNRDMELLKKSTIFFGFFLYRIGNVSFS